MLDVIKSYLVSLGFQVDSTAFNKAKQSVDNMDKVVDKFAGNSVKNYLKAGAAITSFFAAANIGIAKYLEGLAKADLQNGMFARRMWMSKENAVAYKNTMSALGAELQDLYLSPELLQRYNELRKQAEQMAPPGEYDDAMKQIRDVTFEFQRMKLEATYAMQWIGYYLYKYLEKPIGDFKKQLSDLNDNLTLKMPEWTKKIAQIASWIVRMGSAGVWGFNKLKEAISELSPETKAAGAALVGFFALLKSGPIGWMIAGITALLLLMDDFKTYQEGGESLFGDEWEKLEELKKSMKDDGTFDDFKESLDSISTSLGDILDDLNSIANKIATNLGFDSFSDLLVNTVNRTLKDTSDLLGSIADALDAIDAILSDDKTMGEKLNDFASGVVDKSSLNPIKGFENKDSWAYKYAKYKYGEDMANKMQQDYVDTWSGIKATRKKISDWFIGLFTKHADGGIQTTPHLGYVAEDGPEAIIPLSANRRQKSLNLLAKTAGMLDMPITGANNTTINTYNFTNSPQYRIYGSEPTATARAVDRNFNWGILTRNFKGVQ